jgi:hypothetical protein
MFVVAQAGKLRSGSLSDSLLSFAFIVKDACRGSRVTMFRMR